VERRQHDPRIATLVIDVAELKRQMTENTAVTVQVRDILASFRILGKIAKWIAAMGAAAVAVWHGIRFFKGG
jgi:hypothetical protein